jgi:endogenous inhibitor of DNA gyrase (YacG/DUF329 family)
MDVRCPTCKKKGDWLSGTFAPFCSKRCKLIDLGKWFSGENKISEPLRPDSLEDLEGVEEDQNSQKKSSEED